MAEHELYEIAMSNSKWGNNKWLRAIRVQQRFKTKGCVEKTFISHVCPKLSMRITACFAACEKSLLIPEADHAAADN